MAPTASPGTATAQIANTVFVATALGSYLPLSGGTLTGNLTTVTGSNALQVNNAAVVMNTSASGLAALAVNGPGVAFSTAYMSFNRAGQFACYFGLDADNTLKVGGWSFGNNAYHIMHEGISGLTVQSPQITGTMAYGGVSQPHIFVQSSTPTAQAVGDLWFF